MTYFTAVHHYTATDGSINDGFAGVLTSRTGKWRFKTAAEARKVGKRRPADARKGRKVRVEIERWEPWQFVGKGRYGFKKGRIYTSKFEHTREMVEKFFI